MDYGDWLEGGCLDEVLRSTLPEVPAAYPDELETLVAQLLVDGYWRAISGSTAEQRARNLGQIQYLATRFGVAINRYLVPADMGAKLLSIAEMAAYDAAASGRDFEAHLFRPALNTQLPCGCKDWSEVIKGFDPQSAKARIYDWRSEYR